MLAVTRQKQSKNIPFQLAWQLNTYLWSLTDRLTHCHFGVLDERAVQDTSRPCWWTNLNTMTTLTTLTILTLTLTNKSV